MWWRNSVQRKLAAARASRGASILDSLLPGWYRRTPKNDAISALRRDFTKLQLVKVLDLRPVDYGLEPDYEVNLNQSMLEKAWRREIDQRYS